MAPDESWKHEQVDCGRGNEAGQMTVAIRASTSSPLASQAATILAGEPEILER